MPDTDVVTRPEVEVAQPDTDVASCTLCDQGIRHGHFIKLNHEGDDPTFTWDPDEPTQVEAARAMFDSYKTDGMLLYRINEDDTRDKLTTFDPHAARIMATPHNAGG